MWRVYGQEDTTIHDCLSLQHSILSSESSLDSTSRCIGVYLVNLMTELMQPGLCNSKPEESKSGWYHGTLSDMQCHAFTRMQMSYVEQALKVGIYFCFIISNILMTRRTDGNHISAIMPSEERAMWIFERPTSWISVSSNSKPCMSGAK